MGMEGWGIDSEYGRLRDVLLCQPEHYDWFPLNAVARASLASGARPDPQTVRREYREFEDALDQAGVRRHYLTPEPHLGYQVYTRDSSQMTPWGVLLTQMFKPMRRGEYAPVLDFYARLGCPMWRHANHGTIEGGDIAVIRPGLLAIGYTGTRTDLDGATQLKAWFEAEGWEVRLVPLDEHFLHLDVVFCMVEDGLAVGCTQVLEDGFIAWLGGHGIRLVDTTYREVIDLSCNLLALGDARVISARHSARLNAALRAEGITVLDPDLRVITRGGGGAHCMTMPLRRDAVAAR
jgi:N-dimethylarginine dimethylaminohydrolase